MISDPHINPGLQFTDERGTLNFFNNFEMSEVVRFYEIIPNSINTIRAWQAHKIEKKWFYCHSGSFLLNLIKVENFKSPSDIIQPYSFVLQASVPAILFIPGGFASGFRALEKSSKLQVFSNFDLEQSKKDDYRYPPNFWNVDWQFG